MNTQNFSLFGQAVFDLYLLNYGHCEMQFDI